MTGLAVVSMLLATITFGPGFTFSSAVDAAENPCTQTTASRDPHERQDATNEPEHGAVQAPSSTQHMMRMHEQMMAEMKAADARLDALLKNMNTATGDARIAAIAAVVNELAQQRKVMSGHMGQMCEHMKGGPGMKNHR